MPSGRDAVPWGSKLLSRANVRGESPAVEPVSVLRHRAAGDVRAFVGQLLLQSRVGGPGRPAVQQQPEGGTGGDALAEQSGQLDDLRPRATAATCRGLPC